MYLHGSLPGMQLECRDLHSRAAPSGRAGRALLAPAGLLPTLSITHAYQAG